MMVELYDDFSLDIDLVLFSSPEPKAGVSFSNRNLSVVRRCRCFFPRVDNYEMRKYIDKLKKSSREPLGQFQPN